MHFLYKSDQVGPAVTTTTTTTIAPAKAITVTAAFAKSDWVQDLLDRLPVRIQVSSGGVPLAGAVVTMEFTGAVVGQTTTAADGTALVELKLANPTGRVAVALLIRASKPGFTDGATVLKQEFTFNALGTVIALDPILGTRKAGEVVVVSGTVYSAVGGLRLNAGVPSIVTVIGAGGIEAPTDSSGRFSVRVPVATEITVRAVPNDGGRYLPSQASLSVDVADRKSIVLEAAGDRDIYGSGDVITINGTAFSDGKPAAAIINVIHADAAGTVRGVAPIATDSIGAFSVRLPPLPNLFPNSRMQIRVTASGIGLSDSSTMV